MSPERNSVSNKIPATRPGSMKGVEVLLRGSGAGISVRSLSGTFGQIGVISADANLLLGPPGFTLSVGGSKRATTVKIGTKDFSQVFTFARVGVQMSFLVGGSRLRAQVGGWGYVPTEVKEMKIGGEGEASIIYTPPVVPIYVQLGYRTEVFTSKSGTTLAPEEIRGLRLGAGFQFGGK